MVFQSSLRYENGTAQLREVDSGVYVIETNVEPVYSYFRPDPQEQRVPSQGQPNAAEDDGQADSNK